MGTAAVRRAIAGQGNNPQPVIPMGENGLPIGTIPSMPLYVRLLDDNSSSPITASVTSVDGFQTSNNAVYVLTHPLVFNGATWDRLRTPTTFKPFSVSVASLGIGPQTVWTPTSGKRFRLMGFTVTSDKAVQIIARDGTVASIANTGAVVAATPFSGLTNLGNGYLSASVNNTLQLDVSASVPVALTGTAWGTEE